MYRHVEIKYAKLGVENFDFSLFNKTKVRTVLVGCSAIDLVLRRQFGGLENTLLNSYCNSMLQTLYFMPQLRMHVLNHLCSKVGQPSIVGLACTHCFGYRSCVWRAS